MEEIIFTEEQKARLRQLGAELAEAAKKKPGSAVRVALYTKSSLCYSLANNGSMTPEDRRKAIFKPW